MGRSTDGGARRVARRVGVDVVAHDDSTYHTGNGGADDDARPAGRDDRPGSQPNTGSPSGTSACGDRHGRARPTTAGSPGAGCRRVGAVPVTSAPRATRNFRAMGCRSTIVIEGAGCDRLAELAMIRIARLEACWSLFLPDSDVSRINRADGASVGVRPATLTLLRTMAEATAVTGGAYDPTVRGPESAGPWVEAVAVDVAAAVVQAAPGTTFDPGGIGKGLASDLVVAEAIAAGATAAAVVIGGDGRVASAAGGKRRWLIEITAPSGSPAVDRIEVGDAAVATSGCTRDHLIDPATRQVVRGETVIQASVLAGTGASAEALTKAVLIGDAGVAEALDLQGIGVLTVGADGCLTANSTWRRHRPSPERAAA